MASFFVCYFQAFASMMKIRNFLIIPGPSGQSTYSLELIDRYSSLKITIDKRERVRFNMLHAYPVFII